jgi:hypothetical protein
MANTKIKTVNKFEELTKKMAMPNKEFERKMEWLQKVIVPTTNKFLNLMAGVCWLGAGYFHADGIWFNILFFLGVGLFAFEIMVKK